jgi:hypothetical protein
MSMKHPGRCTPRARVSLSPSKIPYGGFSPVRLQTGRRARPSSSHDLYAPQARVFCPMAPCEACLTGPSRPLALPSRGPSLGDGLCCPTTSTLLRPHLRLSTLRTIYDLDVRSVPNGVGREGPHFYLRVCVPVPPSVPRWTGRVHLAVPSPPAQAFAISAVARRPQPPRPSVPTRLRHEAAKFA